MDALFTFILTQILSIFVIVSMILGDSLSFFPLAIIAGIFFGQPKLVLEEIIIRLTSIKIFGHFLIVFGVFLEKFFRFWHFWPFWLFFFAPFGHFHYFLTIVDYL